MLSWSTTVHTTLSTDTQPTIIVTFENAKYVINASENTRRAFLESNVNWKKTKALFFTQSKVETTSGLAGEQLQLLLEPYLTSSSAGLIMSFADATFSKLALYGPPGLKHIAASSRFYVFRYLHCH
jgi:ribonuclease Z